LKIETAVASTSAETACAATDVGAVTARKACEWSRKVDFLTVEVSTLVVIIGFATNAGAAPALEISDRSRRRARLVLTALKVGDRLKH
jgi:hypothetical protein